MILVSFAAGLGAGMRLYWCPGWESNPHEEKSPEDFKSSASAIPPPGHRQYQLNELKDLAQQCLLTPIWSQDRPSDRDKSRVREKEVLASGQRARKTRLPRLRPG